MPKRRFQALVLTFFLAACIGVPLEAEPVVIIESPILGSDMAGLQEILDQSIADFAAEIDELTGETLEKPDFLRGSSYATSQAILSSLSVHDVTRPFIAIGSSAAYYSPWLSTAVVSELDSLDVTSDVDAGACVQPLVLRGGLPLNFLLDGLSVMGTGGYMDATTGPFGVTSITASLSAQYVAFRPKSGAVAWNGLTFSLGGGFASQTLSVTIEADEITQTIPIDPDGPGPLAPFEARVSVEPTIKASIETLLLSCNAGAMTGVTFLKAFTLFAGGGVSAGWGRSEITIDSKDPINVSGYLGDLIDTPGTIGVTGTADEYADIFIRPYLAGGLAFSVGAFELAIPITFKPVDAISVAVFFGVRL